MTSTTPNPPPPGLHDANDIAPRSALLESQAAPKPDEAPSGHSEENQKSADKDDAAEPEPQHSGRPLHTASDLKNKFDDKKKSLAEKNNPPGGFDKTPLPDFPPGFTVKFTFHRAWNLPIADIPTAAADPFVHATLNADVPKRHKEDPNLRHRTRTERKTLEPAWEEEWVVANIPRTGFRLKCRLYDEDYPDSDDRLGNVTYISPMIDENWPGLKRHTFEVKKRSGSKRAYFLKAAESFFNKDSHMTPFLELSIEVLGHSSAPGAQMYTISPTRFIQHFSPMIGRLTGVKVNREESDERKSQDRRESESKKAQRYDFQAIEMQLQGPVPPEMYHRYVEFKRFVGPMFSSAGLRGRVLNKVLHKQHRRVYNYDSTTKYGNFEPCSNEASLQFLQLAHFDEGGRVFTYVLTLDGLLRFTETGKEFGIDMLSKHTMHSDVETYIACSGEFFIRRKHHKLDIFNSHKRSHSGTHNGGQTSKEDSDEQKSQDQRRAEEQERRHVGGEEEPVKNWEIPGREASSSAEEGGDKKEKGEEKENEDKKETEEKKPKRSSESNSPPRDPRKYELIIDNDSGTYRPDKSILPLLHQFLECNFPDLEIRAMHCDDDELKKLKADQHEAKKKTGPRVHMVLNRSPSSSSISSSDESDLSSLDQSLEHESAKKSKRERAWDALNDPKGGFQELKGSLARRPKDAAAAEQAGKAEEVKV
ncbi:hypothetical protein ACKVV1_000127 [Pyricularia oryzae]